VKVLYGYFLESIFYGIFQKASKRDLVARHLMGGTPKGWPAKEEVELHGAPHGTPIWHILFMKGIKWGHFGIFEYHLYPLAIL
jgi:hypothetical protein